MAEFTVLDSAEISQVETELKSLQRENVHKKRGGGAKKSRSQSSLRGEAGWDTLRGQRINVINKEPNTEALFLTAKASSWGWADLEVWLEGEAYKEAFLSTLHVGKQQWW